MSKIELREKLIELGVEVEEGATAKEMKEALKDIEEVNELELPEEKTTEPDEEKPEEEPAEETEEEEPKDERVGGQYEGKTILFIKAVEINGKDMKRVGLSDGSAEIVDEKHIEYAMSKRIVK